MVRILTALLLVSSAAMAQDAPPVKTIRICDSNGCSERPRSASSFDPAASANPEEDRRIAALSELARQDPRAAYDLGLRYFRGDGVRQDSYQALQWMRDAGERGHLQAQLAVGRFYLMGLEEMGSDPAEAEKWLSIAAGRGNKEAKKLLAEASAAKKSDAEYRKWRDRYRDSWYGYWYSGYPYLWVWRSGAWYYR